MPKIIDVREVCLKSGSILLSQIESDGNHYVDVIYDWENNKEISRTFQFSDEKEAAAFLKCCSEQIASFTED